MSDAGATQRLPLSHALLVATTTVVVVLYVYVWIALPLSMGRGLSGGYDFGAYYSAAQRLRAGAGLYSFDNSWPQHDGTTALPYLYPPLLAGLLSPLGGYSRETATNRWAAFNYLLLIPIVMLLAGVTSPLPRAAVACAPALLLAFCLPLGFTIELGQANVLVLFLLVAAWLAWERDLPHAAAVALALATMIKLTPALPLIFVCRQRPRTAITALVCALVISAFYAGPTAAFLRVLPALAQPAQNFKATNQSLPAFIDRLFIPNPRVNGIADAPAAAAALGIIGRLALLALFVLICRRPVRSRTQFQLGFGLAILISLLLPRVTWVHHHVACVIPVLAIVNGLTMVSKPSRALGYVALSLATLLVWLPPVWFLEPIYDALRHTPGGALWVAYPFNGTFLMLELGAWLYFRDGERVKEEAGLEAVKQRGISKNATAPAAAH